MSIGIEEDISPSRMRLVACSTLPLVSLRARATSLGSNPIEWMKDVGSAAFVAGMEGGAVGMEGGAVGGGAED